MKPPFKVKFDNKDYADILPKKPPDDDFINYFEDNPKKHVWEKQPYPSILIPEFFTQEAKRLRQGVWISIKGYPIWLPPNYYQFLQYGNANGEPPQFRLKRLKAVYHKIRVRKNPRFVGTYNLKNRQDGDTTITMSDDLWEVNSGDFNHGMIGIQSKTRSDAQNPCWFTLCSQWNGYPKFFKEMFYPHFASGNNIAEKMQFIQKADPNNLSDLGKNIVIQFGPAVFNAFDGKNNMRRCNLDEVNKWIEASFWETFLNYMKFIMPGKQRKGLFDIFSSPSDTNGRHNDEAYEFWKRSDMNNLNPETGSTYTRVARYYLNPLDGIEGFYDQYGDADAQEILEHIHRERNSKPKDKLMAEVRGFPLPIIGTDDPNEDEMFGSTDSNSIWINKKGIAERRIYILKHKPSLVVYGNLEWPMNVQDSGEPIFRAADKMQFDDEVARFCFSHTQLPRVQLSDFKSPPKAALIENVIGADPFNLRYGTQNAITGSQGAAIGWRCRDLSNMGLVECPVGAYFSRPWHKSIFHEDMILLCIYLRAMMQYENSNDDLENYFEDRGYSAWMFVSDTAKPIDTPDGKKVRRGDAPAGRGANKFLNNGINLINGVTNLSLTPEEKYLLSDFNFEEPLEDLLDFDKANTQKSHFTMAFIEALMGRNKLLFQKQRKKSNVNNTIMNEFMS